MLKLMAPLEAATAAAAACTQLGEFFLGITSEVGEEPYGDEPNNDNCCIDEDDTCVGLGAVTLTLLLYFLNSVVASIVAKLEVYAMSDSFGAPMYPPR